MGLRPTNGDESLSIPVMLSEAKHLLFLHFYKQILRRFAPQNDRAERLSRERSEESAFVRKT